MREAERERESKRSTSKEGDRRKRGGSEEADRWQRERMGKKEGITWRSAFGSDAKTSLRFYRGLYLSMAGKLNKPTPNLLSPDECR